LSDLSSLRELMLRNSLIRRSNMEAASFEIIPFFDDIFVGDENDDGVLDCKSTCGSGCL